MSDSSVPAPDALRGLTLLDIAGPLGNYCGKLFADLGASVILVEPLTGAPTRRLAPRTHGRDDADASLTFQYQNTNKRSIALDLDQPAGQDVLRRLARHAHGLIESAQPGELARRRLDWPRLREENPALVMTSITPFGQHGPFAHWLATDLTAMAMGGMLYLAGYTDSAPMVACGEQAVGAANVFAAVATMAALLHAEAGGQGQHVDVSMQECVVMGMENAVQFYDLEGTIRQRTAGKQRLAGTGVFPCQDGYVYLMAGGVGSNRFWAATTQWLCAEGVAGADELTQPRWNDQDFLAGDEARAIFARIFAPFAQAHTKAQLHEKSRRHRIPLAPISDARDIAASPQRAHRGYFVETTDAAGTVLRMPGAPYRLSATPWALRRRAPGLGEHTRETLQRAGFGPAEQQRLFESGVVR